MSMWFRYHATALHNPRVRKLPDDLFRLWVNCMCMVCLEGDTKKGTLPPIEDCADMLRMSVDNTVDGFRKLEKAGLLKSKNETKHETKCNVSCNKNETKSPKNETLFETVDETFHVVNWTKKQFKSDTSTNRVREHRQRMKQKDGTAPESESDTKQNITNQKGEPSIFDVENYLDDTSRKWATGNAPQWDMKYLINHYNLMVRNGTFQIPDKPSAAFASWCKSFTKGKPPQ